MKRIEVKDLASNASAYELEDGRIFRIHMNLKTPVSQLATADYVEVETNGYQINKDGAFMVDDNGEPVTIPTQRARIPLSNVRAGTDSVKPGWQRKDLPADEADLAEATKDAKKLKKLPASAEQGSKVLVGDELFVYGEGLYESVRRQRLSSLVPLDAVPGALDQETIDSLIP